MTASLPRQAEHTQPSRPRSQQQPPAVVARRIVQYVEEVQVAAVAVGVPPDSPLLGGGGEPPPRGEPEPEREDLEAASEEEDEVRVGSWACLSESTSITSPLVHDPTHLLVACGTYQTVCSCQKLGKVWSYSQEHTSVIRACGKLHAWHVQQLAGVPSLCDAVGLAPGLGPDNTAGGGAQSGPQKGHARCAHRRTVFSAITQTSTGPSNCSTNLTA